MREMTLDEVKRTQLEILDVVMTFCEERGINCWLDYGTLLGAVRHKGYIPWDDDIDLGMLRPDYDRFMAEFNGYNPRYEFHCIENDPHSEFPFGKVLDNHTVLYGLIDKGRKRAVNIDIWPHDNAPDDDTALQEMFNARDYYWLQYYRRLIRIFAPANGNILRRLCVYAYRTLKKLAFLFSPRFDCHRKAAENSKRYNNQDTKRIGSFMAGINAVCSKEAFSSFIDGEFEGKQYKIPAGYDEWLTALYGDYMTPPPPEQRVTHHTFKAYKKD